MTRRKKKKLPYEAQRYMNFTGVGFIFDMSAIEVAAVLDRYGLREDKKPTELALKNYFAKEFMTDKTKIRIPWDAWKMQNDGKYWRWSTDHISILLMKEGLIPKPAKYTAYLEKMMADDVIPRTVQNVERILESVKERSAVNV